MAELEYLKSCTRPILYRKPFHMRCICHIINLCVHDGLKAVADSAVKFRNIISFTKSSNPRKQTFKSLCQGLYLKTYTISSRY